MIKVESKDASFGINVPTSRAELTKELFDALLKNVHVAHNYCIIALCYQDTLFGIINKRKETVGVIPIIAKIGDKETETTGFKQMECAVLDRTSIERGYHLYLKDNYISPSYLANYISKDSSLCQSVTTGSFQKKAGFKLNDYVITLEFKVIPVCDLRAAVDNIALTYNPLKAESNLSNN